MADGSTVAAVAASAVPGVRVHLMAGTPAAAPSSASASASTAASALPTHPHLLPSAPQQPHTPHHHHHHHHHHHRSAAPTNPLLAAAMQRQPGPFLKGAWRIYIGKQNHPSPPPPEQPRQQQRQQQQEPEEEEAPRSMPALPAAAAAAMAAEAEGEEANGSGRRSGNSAGHRGLRPLGWRLADDGMVYGPIRQEWFAVCETLIKEHRLARDKARGFIKMMRFFAQCQAQAKLSGSVASHVVITDPSAGLTKLVESFLASSSADAADSAAEGERQGADGDGGVKEEGSEEEGGGPEELLRLLTSDEGACYLIEDSTSGRHSVRCNARMADMFVSTEELQALMAQTGLAVGHLIMRLMESEETVRVLAREMALMALDRYGQPTIDIPLQCQTRWGESLRCLGTVGVYLNEHGQSTLILRLWPLGSARWFGVDELKHLPPTTTTVAAGYKRPRSDSLSSAVSTLGDDDDPTTAIHQPIIPQPPPPAPMTRAHSVHSFAPSGGGLCTLGAATPLAPPAVIPPENSTTTASNSSNNKAGAGGVGLQLQWGPVLCAPSSAAAGTAPPVPVVAASADDTPLSKRARADAGIAWDGQNPYQPLTLTAPREQLLYAPIKWAGLPGAMLVPVRTNPLPAPPASPEHEPVEAAAAAAAATAAAVAEEEEEESSPPPAEVKEGEEGGV